MLHGYGYTNWVRVHMEGSNTSKLKIEDSGICIHFGYRCVDPLNICISRKFYIIIEMCKILQLCSMVGDMSLKLKVEALDALWGDKYGV